MDDLNHSRPLTPPHHPTAGVFIHPREIKAIAACAFPASELVSILQLPSGKSYNNRIYFLKLRLPAGQKSDTSSQSEQQLILKLNGRFFGANKIQNEVACFQLVHTHCPDIPAPRALAWSEDGNVATFATPFNTETRSLELPEGVTKLDHGGWILMSQVLGSPMAVTELDEATLMRLGGQLGDIIASLRQNIPPQRHCGNIRLPLSKPGNQIVPTVDSSALAIRDILQDGIMTHESITTPNEYYMHKLTDKLQRLETSDTFAPNRMLIGPLRDFISEALPHLELIGGGIPRDEFVLTHYDLSPRNVLVSGQPPHISGLVDFEFAGFFPPVEEFLNDYIANSGDWPRLFYDAYLARLGEKGVATPARGFDPDIWDRNYNLEILATRIAPWDLPGGYSVQELQKRLKEAEVDVRKMLRKLSSPGRY